MDAMLPLKNGPTQARWASDMRDRAFDLIRNRKLMETASEHFLQVLHAGTISTNVVLRRLHNFAVGMHWLPWPVLPKLKWPAVEHKERRAITAEEHKRIIDREHNPEIRAYYQLLGHLGGSQTDIADLNAEDIDWKERTVPYQRRKTGVPVIITFGADAASVLESLPKFGPLFPSMARIKENHRAKMFIKRLRTVGIIGISLHSYRYAWEERAKTVGMPERFAQQALGHSSKAFVRGLFQEGQGGCSFVGRLRGESPSAANGGQQPRRIRHISNRSNFRCGYPARRFMGVCWARAFRQRMAIFPVGSTFRSKTSRKWRKTKLLLYKTKRQGNPTWQGV